MWVEARVKGKWRGGQVTVGGTGCEVFAAFPPKQPTVSLPCMPRSPLCSLCYAFPIFTVSPLPHKPPWSGAADSLALAWVLGLGLKLQLNCHMPQEATCPRRVLKLHQRWGFPYPTPPPPMLVGRGKLNLVFVQMRYFPLISGRSHGWSELFQWGADEENFSHLQLIWPT